MNYLLDLFTSPELYPMRVDFRKHAMTFVRMSGETYRASVFLDGRTQHLGSDSYEIRMDDLLLAAGTTPEQPRSIHYILHPTFCCSTLLARYFELLPNCFVLKEPVLLTQLALTRRSLLRWNDAFALCARLLARAYDPQQFVIIKPHEPCNVLGSLLLEHNDRATITFLTTPLRDFLLSILKAEDRRAWVQRRLVKARESALNVPSLANADISSLHDAEAAAYLWLVNRYLCQKLSSGPYRSRVLVLDGGRIADFPKDSLRAVASLAGLPLSEQQLQWMIDHPSMRKYSKDLSRPYDANSRHQELAELENSWRREADAGARFVECCCPEAFAECWFAEATIS
ncbi:MAG TPA: hypothetical protein VKZ53_30610 [Candidatus Angelobacter sp.]|nr:hypothetical protein [Candidatus Angelobacter sp.]